MDTNQTAAKKITVVGIGPRAAAMLIDVVIVVFFGIFAGVFVGIVLMLLQVFTGTLPLDILIYLSGIVISILYYIVPWSRTGQTIGKTALQIKIISEDGEPPATSKAILRYIGYYISGLIAALGFLWVNIDKERQGWHDKLARTHVVYTETEFSETDQVIFVPDKKSSWIWYVIWAILLIIMPLGLVITSAAVGPYIAGILVNILGGIR